MVLALVQHFLQPPTPYTSPKYTFFHLFYSFSFPPVSFFSIFFSLFFFYILEIVSNLFLYESSYFYMFFSYLSEKKFCKWKDL